MVITAFAYWDNRISPVFDTTRQIHVVADEALRIVGERTETLPESPPVQKVLRLVELGVQTLVCGAISKPMHEVVAAYGIQVVPFVAGTLPDVVAAWFNGQLDRDVFAMPGCRNRKRRAMRRRRQGDRPGSPTSFQAERGQ